MSLPLPARITRCWADRAERQHTGISSPCLEPHPPWTSCSGTTRSPSVPRKHGGILSFHTLSLSFPLPGAPSPLTPLLLPLPSSFFPCSQIQYFKGFCPCHIYTETVLEPQATLSPAVKPCMLTVACSTLCGSPPPSSTLLDFLN